MLAQMIGSEDLIAYVERVHERTYEAVERLRDDLVEWKPRGGEFSAGELVMHIANSRLMNLGAILGRGTRYPGHEPPPRATVRVLERYLEETSAETLRGLRGADLGRRVRSLSGQERPAYMSVLGGLIEHEVHHRSQLCEYLSGAGVEPPALYGLHAEDLPR
jgi:uncharacterized damage-inducible protein DinB